MDICRLSCVSLVCVSFYILCLVCLLPNTRYVVQPLACERAPAPQPTARAEVGLREEQERRLRSRRRAIVGLLRSRRRARLD